MKLVEIKDVRVGQVLEHVGILGVTHEFVNSREQSNDD